MVGASACNGCRHSTHEKSSFLLVDSADKVPIIKGQREDFDYRQGEPPSDILTILRVLDVSHLTSVD